MCALFQPWDRHEGLLVSQVWGFCHQRWDQAAVMEPEGVAIPGPGAALSRKNTMRYSNVSHFGNFQVSSSHIFQSEKKLVKLTLNCILFTPIYPQYYHSNMWWVSKNHYQDILLYFCTKSSKSCVCIPCWQYISTWTWHIWSSGYHIGCRFTGQVWLL